ncbi:DUF6903 family protein [Senegalia massiliensis]|uniref:DUF6903 family protein n=1 Tax=Senegalia massiliensis TaxID=1720316 RepID=UPI0013EF0FA3|nr:hypothetical protein [Senegalia massiliensis]
MNKIKGILATLFFIISLYLIIKGQTIRDLTGVSMMMIGLAVLLVELYLYNKKYV